MRIATRKSALALWQAEHVAARLRQEHPRLQIKLLPMSTRGDEVLDRSLAAVGGKGLFLKELETALAEGRADLAVHSLKDMPAGLAPGFELAAVLARADSADALVSKHYGDLAALPQGARVGTSSLRRQALLRYMRPDLELLDLRSNVHTRLAKRDAGDYEAIILAAAGLERLGLGKRARARLSAPAWLPAPGQAAIAVETRAGDAVIAALLAPLEDRDTRAAVTAERAMNQALGGSCSLPVGAWCTLGKDGLTLFGMVGDSRGSGLLRAQASAAIDAAQALGEKVAARLRAAGADVLLAPHLSR